MLKLNILVMNFKKKEKHVKILWLTMDDSVEVP